MTRTERQIAMIEMTLKNDADIMTPEKVQMLQDELAALKGGAPEPTPAERQQIFADSLRAATGAVSVTVRDGDTTVVSTGRYAGRTRKAAARATRTAPVAQTAPPPAPAPAPAPTVAVTTADTSDTPVTFKRLRTGAWGLTGVNLVPGATVKVLKRDQTTTEVVVGRIVWQGPDGSTLAQIGG